MRSENIYDTQEINNKEFFKTIMNESIQNQQDLKLSSQEVKNMVFSEIKDAWVEDYRELVKDIEKMIQYLESKQFKSDFEIVNK